MRSVVALLAMVLALAARADEDVPAVAAAADLQFALTNAAELFAQQTGRRVKLSFGSSGSFARQLQQGAPFQLFLSADERYVELLRSGGVALDAGTLYAVGRIVVFAPRGSPVKPDGELRDLGTAAGDGRLRHLAIANPEHAPYGRAAQEALSRAGLWERVRGRLVLGENAAQAAQFATSGSAQAGIIPYSLALAPAVSALGSYALIPADRHGPLRQRMVLIKGARETARAFYVFLQQPPARAIFERYGFALPGPG